MSTLENKTSRAAKLIAPPAPGERRAYTVNEFCCSFRISRATVYRLINDGRLHSIALGGRRLIPVESAEALLAGGEAVQKAKPADAA